MKMEAMERRLDRRLSNEGRSSVSLHRKLAQTRHASSNSNQSSDLTDYMNDVFFGTTSSEDHKKVYNITEGGGRMQDEDDFDSSTRSVSSRMTQEWLEEAKRIVASSPSRGGDSPSKFVASPRFASQGRLSTSSIEKRDPFSRSARRHRAPEGISVEILSRTANHTRNNSDSYSSPPHAEQLSPASDIQKWISTNLKTPNSPEHTISPDPTPPSPTTNLWGPPLPPRQSIHRRSRFQTDPKSPSSHLIPPPTNPPTTTLSKRTFKNTATSTNNNALGTTILDSQLLSPPKQLVESTHRRSISTSSSSVPGAGLLSPPRNLVESAHRRSISSSTCRTDKIVKESVDDWPSKNEGPKAQDLNGFLKDKEFNVFLKEQRFKLEMLLNGQINGKAKIVLSGPSNSISSMVAATCYAWLTENKNQASQKDGGRNSNRYTEFVVPVMNMRRGKMWKQRQAAWLFHNVGLDATSLLFSNEVELETLMMAKQLSILVVGEDILKTNGEVGSPCTLLTDNYCEDAYDLLQTPILQKLLMAGILLDTQNLRPSPKMSMTRDAEAVQLLSVSSAPNFRNTFFDQLMQDHRDDDFFEAARRTYGKPPSDTNWEGSASTNRRTAEKISPNEVTAKSDDKKQNEGRVKKVSPVLGKPAPSPVQTTAKEPAKRNDPPRPKTNFFAKLFGFGSK